MTPPHILINDLTYCYGPETVLDRISVSWSDRRVAIIGRNGSGKSTLARVLCGLIAPTSGSVRIDDHDPFRDRKKALRTVGILFQNPDHQIIFPTVGEEIAFGLTQLGLSKKDSRAKVDALLNEFGKSDWRDRSVSTLSQGQRQLVCLMSVLAMQPRVIVLDEPLSGLDIPTTRALMAYLDAVPQMIVHITHDPRIAETYDRVIWIDQGRILANGTPQDVVPSFLTAMQAATGL